MKRIHISLNVTDLNASVAYYSNLLASEPTLRKDDYAQWLLDDPHVNFVLEAGSEAAGLGHLGLQMGDLETLEATRSSLDATGTNHLLEGETTCCYHRSEKSWSTDPDGIAWEAFVTHEETEERGNAMPALGGSATGGCC